MDSVLYTNKQFIISDSLPRPRFGNVKFNQLQQLHVWLKGYCGTYVDNFKHDCLHPNHAGSRLLSMNTELTLQSCKAFTL